MKRAIPKLLAIVLIVTMITAFAAVPVSASSTPNPLAITINHFLVLDGTNYAPAKEFVFTIANGAAVNDVSKLPILAGKLNESFTKRVTYNSSSPVVVSASTDPALSGQNVASGSITIDEIIDPSLYTAPGIYRYTVTETAVSTPYSLIGEAVKYIDVYVEYPDAAPDTLTVTGAILHDEIVSYDPTTGEASNTTKTASYINKYETNNLTFTKSVTGNQGDKTKFFTFTVKATAGSVFQDSDKFDITFTNGAAFHADNNYTNPYVTGNELNTGFKVILKDTSSVQIVGLPENLSVTVSEDNEEYVVSFRDATQYVTTNVSDASATAAMNGDAAVTFVNDKGGTVPTGILLTVAPFAVGLLVFGAIVIYLTAKRRRLQDED